MSLCARRYRREGPSAASQVSILDQGFKISKQLRLWSGPRRPDPPELPATHSRPPQVPCGTCRTRGHAHACLGVLGSKCSPPFIAPAAAHPPRVGSVGNSPRWGRETGLHGLPRRRRRLLWRCLARGWGWWWRPWTRIARGKGSGLMSLKWHQQNLDYMGPKV
jgi:hypothetical protein